MCVPNGRSIVFDGGSRSVCKAVGAVEAVGLGCPLFAVFRFAVIQFLEIFFGDRLCFVGGELVLPFGHLLVIKHLAGVNLLLVDLNVLVVVGGHADVPEEILLFVKLACVFCDVCRAVPFDLKLFGCLLLL